MKKRFGRFIAIVLSCVLILSAFPMISFVMVKAAEVSTAADFCSRVNASTQASPATIKLTADLVIDGNAESDFYGEIDGNGHVITLTTGSALFNDVKGTVKNLGVIAAKPIITPKNSKAFCGVFASQVSGTVENCFAYADINATFNVSGESFIGGFCAALNASGTIKNSFSCVSIDCSNTMFVGGFVGAVVAGGTIDSCYSSGDIRAQDGNVAGFANLRGVANVSNTYTSCQIVNVSNDALPSGVDGFYDNQLSIMRESVDNPGLSTNELLKSTELGNQFAITSTAYPSLKTFYSRKWSTKAHNVIEVSTAAVAFSDAQIPHKRKEPVDVMVRADYLPYEVLMDRTNLKSFSWELDTEKCKVYDTVPMTSFKQNNTSSNGTHADLLQAKFEFSENVSKAELSVTQNGLSRKWYVSSYDNNPYFESGDGTSGSPYKIKTVVQLNNVRFYSLITTANYVMDTTISNKTLDIGTFDPIEDFIGTFEGSNITFSNVTLTDTHKGDMGLFGNTRDGSVIQNIKINGVKSETTNAVNVGSLIGSAVGTTVKNILVQGSSNSVKSAGISGGVIGKADNSTISRLLISVEVDGSTAGGLIGSLVGGSLTESGSTGLVGGTAATLGGLVGNAQSTAVSNCYSTSAVLSKTANAKAGGLIGTTTSSTLKASYFASVAAVKNTLWTKTQPYIGSGSGASGCTYDGTYFGNTTAVARPNSTYWSTKTNHYPQIKHFSGTDLSLMSTVKLTDKYQHYWSDDKSDNSTTGWIPKTVSSLSFKTPVVNSDFCNESDVKIFNVTSKTGYGYEPKSNVKFVALKTENGTVGVRYVTVIRNDLMPLCYTVSGVTNEPVYLEIGFSSDKTSWTYFPIRAVSNESAHKTLYDIPINSYISVRVYTKDGIVVNTLKMNNTTVVASQDGSYISSSTFNSVVDVAITFKKNTSSVPWGVHRKPF